MPPENLLHRPDDLLCRSWAALQSARHRPDTMRIDADFVNYRLEEAGETLLSLPPGDLSVRLRLASMITIRHMLERYGWPGDGRISPPKPTAEKIARMEEALSWIQIIPMDLNILRRIVGARALVHPITDRHLFSWRGLSSLIGAEPKTVQRWHSDGVDLIVKALKA